MTKPCCTCKNYENFHGAGAHFHCAMYPYGPEAEQCKDWAAAPAGVSSAEAARALRRSFETVSVNWHDIDLDGSFVKVGRATAKVKTAFIHFADVATIELQGSEGTSRDLLK